MPTLTEDLRALMDSLGIARAHLAGLSMGGNEVTMMAGEYPERVDRVVYLDAAYDWADSALVAAFADFPADPTQYAKALVSLEAFRAWFVGFWFPGVTDPGRLEAYVRDLVDVQPDGTVRPVPSDTVAQALGTALATDRRDYPKVKAPALAIYAETFFDTAHGDSAQRVKNLAWEQKHFASFRAKSIDRVKRELKTVEIVSVPGTHTDFFFTSRDYVAGAIRKFLSP